MDADLLGLRTLVVCVCARVLAHTPVVMRLSVVTMLQLVVMDCLVSMVRAR